VLLASECLCSSYIFHRCEMAEINPFAPQAASAAASAAPTLKAAGRSASRYASSASASAAAAGDAPSAFAVAEAREQIGGFAAPVATKPARVSREARRALVAETPARAGAGAGPGDDEDASVVASPPPDPAPEAAAAARRRGACCGAAGTCGACCAAVGRSRCGTMGCAGFAGVFALALFAFSCALLKPSPGVGACGGGACGTGGSVPMGCITLAAPQVSSCDAVCADPGISAVAPFRFLPSLASGGSSADALKGMSVWCGFPQANVNWRVPLTFFTALVAFASVVSVATKRTLWVPLLALLLAVAGCLFLYVMGIDGVATDKGDKACRAGLPGVTVQSWIPPASGGRPTLACDSSIFSAVVVLDMFISPVLLGAAFVLFKHRIVMLQPGYGAPPPPRNAVPAGQIDPKSIVFGDPRAAR